MSHSAEKTAEPADCLDSIKDGQSLTPSISVRFIGLRLWYAGIAQNVYFALQFCYTGIDSHTGSRKVVVKLSEILSALFNPPYRPSH